MTVESFDESMEQGKEYANLMACKTVLTYLYDQPELAEGFQRLVNMAGKATLDPLTKDGDRQIKEWLG